jgi:hypothetical protein
MRSTMAATTLFTMHGAFGEAHGDVHGSRTILGRNLRSYAT